jgi:hypothetical protein
MHRTACNIWRAQVASLDEAIMSDNRQRRGDVASAVPMTKSDRAADSQHQQRIKRHKSTRPPTGVCNSSAAPAVAPPTSNRDEKPAESSGCADDAADRDTVRESAVASAPGHRASTPAPMTRPAHDVAADSDALARLTERRLAEIEAAKQRRAQRLARAAEEDRARSANEERLREITRRARDGGKGRGAVRAAEAAAELRSEATACALGVVEHILALSVGLEPLQSHCAQTSGVDEVRRIRLVGGLAVAMVGCACAASGIPVP